MITNTQLALLRAKLGRALLEVQDEYKHYEASEIIPELIAALVSLAAMVAKDNAGLSQVMFETICSEATREWWGE